MTQEKLSLTDRMRGRDWLMTQDWADDEIDLVLETANQLKTDFKTVVQTLHLPHKTIFLIFFVEAFCI